MIWCASRNVSALVVILLGCSTAAAQSYRGQDTAIGGLAGAVIGGLIGHQNKEAPAGALIGGAVGAVTGSIIGDAKDQQVARNRYYQDQARRYHQAVSRAVSPVDVVNMTRSGISDPLVVNHIRQHGVTQTIGTHDIIALHNQGVSEMVITAMQNARIAGVAPEPVVVHTVPAPAPTVVIHEGYPIHRHRHYGPSIQLRYSTRPAFPAHPSRAHFRHYW